jgi:hypothetical protein
VKLANGIAPNDLLGWGWAPKRTRPGRRSPIIAALLADPALLSLGKWRLVMDIRERFGASVPTALRAVNDARNASRGTSA